MAEPKDHQATREQVVAKQLRRHLDQAMVLFLEGVPAADRRSNRAMAAAHIALAAQLIERAFHVHPTQKLQTVRNVLQNTDLLDTTPVERQKPPQPASGILVPGRPGWPG